MSSRHPVLETKRFALEPMGLAEAPLLADLGADPEVVKTLICDWSKPDRRLEIARDWIAANQKHGIWSVLDRDGSLGAPGQFLGFCAADEPLPLGGLGPELYYAFSQECWGKGVASEVVKAVIAHLFLDRGVAAVEALVLAGLNPASTRAGRQARPAVGRALSPDCLCGRGVRTNACLRTVARRDSDAEQGSADPRRGRVQDRTVCRRGRCN